LHGRALVGISWRHGKDFWWRETWKSGVENNVCSKQLDARLDPQRGYILTVFRSKLRVGVKTGAKRKWCM
jgi:hypothetical protein